MGAGNSEVRLALIDEAPSLNGHTFNPTILIRVVNRVWQLGYDGALAALRAYIAVKRASMTTSGDFGLSGERVFLVTRLLFVPKKGDAAILPVRFGLPDLEPVHQSNWPLFPLAVSRQIPFLLVGGYSLGGLPQDPEFFIEYWDRHGELRGEPLAPEASAVDAATDVVTALRQDFPQAAVESVRGRIYAQALRAMQSIHNTPEAEIDTLMSAPLEVRIALWERHAAAIAALSPHWSAQQQQFVAGSDR